MTKQEIKNRILERKECCKKLAEEYRHRYNEDNTNKLALNMFYHNVIAYNDFESMLAMIEDRKSMIMCFSEPPVLTERTVEVELNRIAELEAYNEKLLDGDIEKHNKIVKLEARIREMKGILLCTCEGCSRLPKLYEAFDKEIKDE